MKRLIREPLVHFLLLGAVLFTVMSARPDRRGPADDEIVVPAGKIEHLAALFARTWRRPPTPAELEGLIEDFVREEAAVREGTAIGLDRDDTIIRRRIRQKLDFIAEDLASRIEPTDEELGAYLAAHEDDFRIEPRLSFRQVFLSPDRRGDRLEEDARELLEVLNADPSGDAATAGDRTLLEHAYADVAPRDVAGLFGDGFAAAVAEMEPGAWRGPVRSAYGAHLVLVDERRPGRVPALAEVRDEVRREWEQVRRVEIIERFYEGLLAKYEVTIEWPELDPAEASP
ncbi:MAG: peptidyl-prolyl cis-trans isomerase [Planctomycetota bacterium]|jgi:hypothetical protein